MKKNKGGKCFKYSSTVAEHQLNGQIRTFINAINFICLFIVYLFACYGMFLSLKGLYLCGISKLVDSGLTSNENIEMLFRGLTNIMLLLVLFPFILLFINYLWKCRVKNIIRELEEEYSNEEQR